MARDVNIAAVADYNSKCGGEFVRTVASHRCCENAAPQNHLSVQRALEFCPEELSLHLFIATAPHAIICATDDGTIQFLNRCAEELFGYSGAEIGGESIALLLDFCPRPTLSMFCSGPRSAKLPARIELNARKKSGEVFPVELLSNPFSFRGKDICIHFIHDISLRRNFEQRIAELQQQVFHLSQHNVLGELASAITHELNQPLTAITNYAAAAQRCGGSAADQELRSSCDLMEKAAGQAKRASQIMQKLRKLVQHRAVECVESDLRGVVEDAVQLATLGTSHHRIGVTMKLPPVPVMVLIDRVQIQVLLTNLVRNAVDELITSNGERDVSVTLRINCNKLAEVSVEDTGPGIAPEVFESIFDPFHTTKPNGLGMGLAICRRIAEAHGGLLTAANRTEGGAVFRFIIPVSSKTVGE